jgi:DNA-binding response OmpR family regulator
MLPPQCRILIVEDHADTRDLLEFVFTDCNYVVKTAATVSEAIKLVNAEDFSVMMFDSRLPDGSGLELCRRVRQFNQTTPIVFCSALAYEADKQGALDAGAQTYLIKPLDLSELLRSVDQLILSGKPCGTEAKPAKLSRP